MCNEAHSRDTAHFMLKTSFSIGHGMHQSADNQWGRRALEFVDAVEHLDAPSVLQMFETEIAACGFQAYIMATLPVLGATLPEITVANGWPVEWHDLYIRENFTQHDPIPRYCATTTQPFEWSDVRYDPSTDTMAHKVMTRAKDFGLLAGYCIPLHYDTGSAAISLAGERPDLDPAVKSALQLIGIYAHNRIRSLVRSRNPTSGPLSDRQCDVLRWAAKGKTAWEASVILGISERTVKFHLNEAARKLNAVNQTSAVATALVRGLIRL
jgi:LuxR family quorum sensing-dependent transcriptional regulator